MPVRTTLFLSNRSQAVRLPRAVAFGDGVREVIVTQDGPRRIIAPADAAWDDFFDAPGIDVGSRSQPAAQNAMSSDAALPARHQCLHPGASR